MVGYSDQFGAEARKILADARQSPNSVEELSERRISHMTVRRMMKGFPPSSDHIIEFVDTVGTAAGWDTRQRKATADRLLMMVNSRAEYRLGVKFTLCAA